MDSELKSTMFPTHQETMDILSRTWCQFAVQAFKPQVQDWSLILDGNSSMRLNVPLELQQKDQNTRIDDACKNITPWQSSDFKSWIWMQQAMHGELNNNNYSKKKQMAWNVVTSIREWLKEIKRRRKESKRQRRAQVHAAVSVAGLAAALAAIASENSKVKASDTMKESAVASAAVLVAAYCAKVADAIGAKKGQLSNVIDSAAAGTSATDIFTLTAAAATSLRGDAMLKFIAGYKNQLNCRAPVLPIEDSSDFKFNFDKCRSVIAKGCELNVEISDGRCSMRSVSVVLSRDAKVILRIKKPNLFKVFARPKESVVQHLLTELEDGENDPCYLIVLTTNNGMVKLHMMDDYQRYKTWTTTINHMLIPSASEK